LSFRVFFPSLTDIWNFDEAYYINNGRLVLQGQLPALGANPFVALFWAIVSLPFHSSQYWMIHTCALGRLISFALLWVSAYRVSKELSHIANPLVTVGLLLAMPTLFGLLDNSSDALFAGLSSLGLWHFLSFIRSAKLSRLVAASVLVALSALARNDGLVLIVVVLILTLFVLRGRKLFAMLIAGALPFLVIVGGYVLIRGFVTGQYDPQTTRRAYDAFEQGEGVTAFYADTARNPFVEGYRLSLDLYGTPEANEYSVLKAIARNPQAYVARLRRTVAIAPAQAFAAYGRGLRGLGAVFLLLSLRGIVYLIQKRERMLLVVLIGWMGHLAVYLLTFFREGYYVLPYHVVFVLAAIGATASFTSENTKRERLWTTTVLVLLTMYGLMVKSTLIAGPAAVILVGLWAIWILLDRGFGPLSREAKTTTGIALLVVVVAIQCQFSRPARCGVPEFPRLGTAPDERASILLSEHLPCDTPVAAYTPAPVVMARMTYVPMFAGLRELETGEDLLAWFAQRNVKALYIDERFRVCEPAAYRRINELRGTSLDLVFADEGGDVQVLLIKETLPSPPVQESGIIPSGLGP
jgi:hypothetical protein